MYVDSILHNGEILRYCGSFIGMDFAWSGLIFQVWAYCEVDGIPSLWTVISKQRHEERIC
jgi:hypothetical protein